MKTIVLLISLTLPAIASLSNINAMDLPDIAGLNESLLGPEEPLIFNDYSSIEPPSSLANTTATAPTKIQTTYQTDFEESDNYYNSNYPTTENNCWFKALCCWCYPKNEK